MIAYSGNKMEAEWDFSLFGLSFTDENLHCVASGVARSHAAAHSRRIFQRLHGFFNDFTARWVRNNPNLAVSSRYTGDERDRLEQQLAPETMEYKKSRILMVGYGPPSTGFSLALKRIGDRLKARLGDEVDVKYVYNILDLGYREDDINWLVEEGVLTLGYQSSGYFSERVPRSTVASGRCWPQSSKRG